MRRASRPLTGARIETHDERRYFANLDAVAPSRGRGSKRQSVELRQGEPASPPHGGADRNDDGAALVAAVKSPPRGGADRNAGCVAGHTAKLWSPPHGGADRNDQTGGGLEELSASPPHGGADRNSDLRVRGRGFGCRPLTGARIETMVTMTTDSTGFVAPSRGRGSKQQLGQDRGLDRRSPPHGGADQNKGLAGGAIGNPCRPLTGARIETRASASGCCQVAGRPLTGARIETARSGR